MNFDYLTSLTSVNPVNEMDTDSLITFIIQRYHEDLRRRFPALITLEDGVKKDQKENHQYPKHLTDHLLRFYDEMLSHMANEEATIFPLISSGWQPKSSMPMKVLNAEHDSHGEQLEQIRKITHNFTPPKGAGPKWITLYESLEKLEEEMIEHNYLENNILFPRSFKRK